MTIKNNTQLINNIIGQLRGIDKMIQEGRDCFRVLNQIKAARSALDSLTTKYIEKEFLSCLHACNREDKSQVCKNFFEQLIKR